MFGKILCLQLWAKMLPAIQILGFFKMQYLKEVVNDEVYVLHANNHWSRLQFGTIILDECNQVCSKYPTYICISSQYLQKSMRDEVEFLPADNQRFSARR